MSPPTKQATPRQVPTCAPNQPQIIIAISLLYKLNKTYYYYAYKAIPLFN